jgi:nucleoside 2-deoxyribosyltransferase
MTGHPRVCLVGHAIVDVTLPGRGRKPKLRLGGIAHAARALWALGVPYTMAYLAPEYLDGGVRSFASGYGDGKAVKIGNVFGSPNVITLLDPAEAGPQGYELLLRDEQRSVLDAAALSEVCVDGTISDFVVFPGAHDLPGVLPAIGRTAAAVHLDMDVEPVHCACHLALGRAASTAMVSTSSSLFLKACGASVTTLCGRMLGSFADAVLLKENRGGSRLFTSASEQPTGVAAQSRKIIHSVGVGDCYDAVYVACRGSMAPRTAMAYASCVAAEYACTTHPDDFRAAASATMEIDRDDIVQLHGVCLPWEQRPKCNVYIAAPDFTRVNTEPIDAVAECLRYHNFSPRRPVRENGEMGEHARPARRQALCDADLKLLEECCIMVAVPLYDDPGTMVEIGIAVQRRMPVIVYDPYGRADNLMLTQLPDLVTTSLDEAISGVFRYSASGGRR